MQPCSERNAFYNLSRVRAANEMQSAAFVQFLLYHFTIAKLKHVVILNCWSRDVQYNYAQAINYRHQPDFLTQYLDISENNDINSTRFLQILEHKHARIGIFLDFNCRSTASIIEIANTEGLFNAHYNWLIFDAQSKSKDFRLIFENILLTIDTELTYALATAVQTQKSSLSLQLFVVFNNGLEIGGTLNMTPERALSCELKACKVEKFYTNSLSRSKYESRQIMTDVQLRVATVVTYMPLSTPEEKLRRFLESTADPDIDTYPRYGFSLIELYKDMLKCGFNYTFYDRWSQKELEGGMAGALITNIADLASTPFTTSLRRLGKLAVIAESAPFRSICIFRTPRDINFQSGANFLEPFRLNVWRVMLILLGFIALFLWLSFRMEVKLDTSASSNYKPTISRTFLLAIGSACIQCSEWMPCLTSGRIAFFSIYFLFFFIYNCYTSTLVSDLLASPIKSNIKTVGQLADSRLSVGFQALAFNSAYLNFSTQGDIVRLRKEKVRIPKHPAGLWLSAEAGIRRVRDDPGFVFVTEASSVFSIVERLYAAEEICDLNELPFWPETKLYTQMNRNSSYKDIIRQKTIRIAETGLQRRLQKYWLKTKLNCYAKNLFIDVGLSQTFNIFLGLFYGYAAAVLVLLFEILLKRFQNRHRIQSLM